MSILDIQEFLNRPDCCKYCDLHEYEEDCTCNSYLWEDQHRGYEEVFIDMYGEAHEYSDEEYSKSNRQKAKAPRSNKKAWCDSCDRNHGPSTETCGVCGNIMGGYSKKSRPMKKESNAR